jgi:hypothetical protein
MGPSLATAYARAGRLEPGAGTKHSIRAVIPRLHHDYEEQSYLERNPVDGDLSMKWPFAERVLGEGIPLGNISIFIDSYECAE